MPYKILLTMARYPGFPHNPELYRKFGATLIRKDCSLPEEFIAAAEDADAILAGLTSIPRSLMEKMKKCRVISAIGIGYEGIDVEAATDLGIAVTNVPDYCLEEVSDHVLALILSCARKIVRLDRAVKEGKWDSNEKLEIRNKIWPPMFRLRGQTLGLIGLGRIARALIPKARGLGLNIVAFDPYIPERVAREMSVSSVSFEELLQESDFISIHTPLTAETNNLFGIKQFRMMKPTAYIINTSRGSIIKEKDLYQALQEGVLAGAALDVTEPEPPLPDNPLLNMGNVIFTAHSAHFSNQSAMELRQKAEENVFSVLDGDLPSSLVNPEVKKKFKARWS